MIQYLTNFSGITAPCYSSWMKMKTAPWKTTGQKKQVFKYLYDSNSSIHKNVEQIDGFF